jgi:hypothetical protein
MPADNNRDDIAPRPRSWAALTVLGFGLAVLAFLVAIDRPHWFQIRPVSGTAAAMAYAATPGETPG